MTLQKNKGYTLLFAVLVSSLVLAIGISILTISKKEFLLATSARDSSEAIYAADSGLECAINSDSAFASDATNGSTVTVNCLALPNPSATVSDHKDSNGTTDGKIFTFHANFGATSCAVVTVTKTTDSSTDLSYTNVDSRGYNTGWKSSDNTCSIPSAKRVERALYYSI